MGTGMSAGGGVSLLQKHVFILWRCDCWLVGACLCHGGCHPPAVHPWLCWTWWNQSEGRYSISPAFTLQRTGRALLYWGNSFRSGSRGSRGIHGTWARGFRGNLYPRSWLRFARGLNEPWSRVAPPPRTRRRPAGGRRPAGTDLMRTLDQLREDGRGYGAGRLLWLP